MTSVSLVNGGKVVKGGKNAGTYAYDTKTKDYKQVTSTGSDRAMQGTYAQENGDSGVYQKNPVVKTPAVISSMQGVEALNQAKKKEAMLTPPPEVSANVSADQVQNAEATRAAHGTAPVTPAAVPAPAPAGSGASATADGTPDTMTLIHPETGQTQTYKNPQANASAIKSLQDQGYQVSESSLSSPVQAETNPDIIAAQRASATAEADMRKIMSDIKRNMYSDTEMRSETNAISDAYDARIQEMQNINARREQAMRTLGERTGMRFTGGMGGVFGGILSEEERQAVTRIASLEGEKQSKIIEAKQAMREQNYTAYTKLIDKAEAISKQKVDALAALKTAQKEQDDKIAAAKVQAENDASIAEQITAGLTSPVDIYAALGGRVPMDSITAITKNLPPPPKNEQFTLGKDEIRYDSTGKVIARGSEAGGGGGGGGTGGFGSNVSPSTASAINDALDGLKFPTVDATKRAHAAVAAKIASGDIEGAKSLILQYAQNSFGETTANVMVGYRSGLESLKTIEDGMKILEDNKIDTNLLTGFAQKSADAIGETDYTVLGNKIGDPKLAKVANDIALAIISFRRAVSGAAFTESEGKSYEAVFPSIGRSKELNTQKIASLRQNFNNGIDSYLSFRINGYDKLFKEADTQKYSSMSNSDLIGDMTGIKPDTSGTTNLSDQNFWSQLK